LPAVWNCAAAFPGGESEAVVPQIIVLQVQRPPRNYIRRAFAERNSLTTATDDGSAGHKGFVTDLIPSFATTADLSSPAGRCRC